MFPVRCYTCNAVVGHMHEEYIALQRTDRERTDVLRQLGIDRLCCRRMFLGHVESLLENQLSYPNSDVVLDRGGTTLYRRSRQAADVDCD